MEEEKEAGKEEKLTEEEKAEFELLKEQLFQIIKNAQAKMELLMYLDNFSRREKSIIKRVHNLSDEEFENYVYEEAWLDDR